VTVALNYPHIAKSAGEPARLERLPRIRVSQIVTDYLNHGWSADEMCLHYPHLNLAEVHSAMAYYFDHQKEIEQELEREQELIAKSEKNVAPTPFETRMRVPRSVPRSP